MFRKMMIGTALATAVAMTIAAVPQLVAQDAPAAPAAPTFNVDPAHSSVTFRVRHINVSFVYGMFKKVSGSMQVTDDNVPQAIEVTIEAASIDTGIEARDRHLRSADFFDVANHANITFKSTKIERVADHEPQDGMGLYTVTGELTLLGQTKTITAGLDLTGRGKHPANQSDRVGIEAMFTIKRSDFGMNYGVENGMIGDDVTLMIALQGVKQ